MCAVLVFEFCCPKRQTVDMVDQTQVILPMPTNANKLTSATCTYHGHCQPLKYFKIKTIAHHYFQLCAHVVGDDK